MMKYRNDFYWYTRFDFSRKVISKDKRLSQIKFFFNCLNEADDHFIEDSTHIPTQQILP